MTSKKVTLESRISPFIYFAIAFWIVAYQGCVDGNASGSGASRSNAVPMAITIDERRDVDLGDHPQGKPLEHTFGVRNTTGSTFTIESVKKSCGCETADVLDGTVVPAGDVLNVRYSIPSYLAGRRSGRLVLVTDSHDESFKEIILTLCGNVKARLWSEPYVLNFGIVKLGKSLQRELRVRSVEPGIDERFHNATTVRGHVTVEIEKASTHLLVFRVILTAPQEGGHFYDLITLKFDDMKPQRLNVRVRAKTEPATLKVSTSRSSTSRRRTVSPSTNQRLGSEQTLTGAF